MNTTTRVIGALALAALVALAARGPAEASTLAARWSLDEDGGSVMYDATSPAENGRIGRRVKVGGGVYEFPGWQDAVTAGGRLKGSISADASLVTVPDPADQLVPKGGAMRVDVRMRARLTAKGTLPARASGGAAPSYNLVQRGLAGDSGGFWKMEIVGYGSREGAVRCVIGDGSSTYMVIAPGRVDDDRWHDVACVLSGGRLFALVDGASASVRAPVREVRPEGAQGRSVSIGKKPGSTDPSDAFSGWLDHVTVTTG